ncbi:sulfatase [Planctomycetales bacterium ZRK34]|nr:sulfatase [Planctomycetales bacterium ZRK34]
MIRSRIGQFAALWFVTLASALMAASPNFVIINIDDLGYADIEPFGSKINRTPHLSRMANEGRRLTSFYAAPVCSPSRSSLMTGCYPKRALPIPHVLFPGYATGLSPNEITIAEVLKSKGYATGMVGKWHLGDQLEFLPTRQGFDSYFGLPYSNDMGPAADGVKSSLGEPLRKDKGKGQPPLPWLRGEKVERRVLADDQQTLVSRYTAEAVKFINAHQKEPFFLYFAHSAVHWPIYPGKAFAGRSKHGYYSDWVEEVDWSVGQVLNTLRDLKLDKNTLVIFTSDNGGTKRGVNLPLRGYKASIWEGGIRVCTIAWWPGKIPAGTSTDAITGMFDMLPTFAHLADAKLPDHKLDGVNIWPQLVGAPDAAPPHDVFYYYRGFNLKAVRQHNWKLHLKNNQLYDLDADIGEKNNLAAQHPDVVKQLLAVAEQADDDLGRTGLGPGVRPLGKVDNAHPIIDHDGTVAPEFR